MHDTFVRQGGRHDVQLLLVQKLRDQLGVRTVQGHVSCGTRNPAPPAEPQTELRLLLLRKERPLQNQEY